MLLSWKVIKQSANNSFVELLLSHLLEYQTYHLSRFAISGGENTHNYWPNQQSTFLASFIHHLTKFGIYLKSSSSDEFLEPKPSKHPRSPLLEHLLLYHTFCLNFLVCFENGVISSAYFLKCRLLTLCLYL